MDELHINFSVFRKSGQDLMRRESRLCIEGGSSGVRRIPEVWIKLEISHLQSESMSYLKRASEAERIQHLKSMRPV